MKIEKKFNILLVWLLLLSMGYLLAWTYTMNVATPSGSDDPREADDRIREGKGGFIERFGVDHFCTASSTGVYDHADTGKHEFITLIDMGSDPTAAAGYAHIYMNNDELFYQDDTDTTCQITKDGQIEYQSITDVNSDTYIVSVDNAGTGTANLIKADANDLATLPDGAVLAAATASGDGDRTIADKGYVDAHGIVQVVNTMVGGGNTGSTIIPSDDTIPQITEGDEYMTLAITPTSATNKLKIEVTCIITNTATAKDLTIALFQDTTASALAAAGIALYNANYMQTITFVHYMTASTTSETTFRVRAGGSGTGTTTFNGSAATRRHGGVAASSITITEIKG